MSGVKKTAEKQPFSPDFVSATRDILVTLVRCDGPDLSARQMAVFLICYLNEKSQTVRGLAQELNVSKPAITRALDRLSELGLVRRRTDPLDRRSVLAQRTLSGSAYLKKMRSVAGKNTEQRKGSIKKNSVNFALFPEQG